MRTMIRWLYRLARLGGDVEGLTSVAAAKIGRHVVNKILGRTIGP